MSSSKLNEKHRRVLVALARHHDNDANYLNFRYLTTLTDLDRREVRLACRALARKGLAQYERGLWSDDAPGGAGYCSTPAGFALVRDDVDDEGYL